MKINKQNFVMLGVGVFVGALGIITAHFVTIKQTNVHYHANFGLYINGKRDEFNNFGYYEEVTSCGGNDLQNPKIRVHMHDNINYVVHVHDSAVTWGHFFANLGYTLGDNLISTKDGSLYVDGQDGKKLTFLLNGDPITSVANRTIGDDDVLLVSYGTENDQAIQKQYESIIQDAKHYDENADPASCSGAKPPSFWDKLERSIWSTDKAPIVIHSR